MADESRRGRKIDASRPATDAIGEGQADAFAADVANASGGEAVDRDLDDAIAGAAGGGTGTRNMPGGTGIGCDDAGGDSGGAAGTTDGH